MIVLVLVLSLFFFSSLFFVFFLHSSHSSAAGISPSDLSKTPGPLVIVPAMTLAYTVMLAAMYALVKRHHRRAFWEAVGWRWPGEWWLGYIFAGGLLAMGLGLLSRFLPIPKSLPMDQFFKDAQGAYLMMIFGVADRPVRRRDALPWLSLSDARSLAADAVYDASPASSGCVWI